MNEVEEYKYLKSLSETSTFMVMRQARENDHSVAANGAMFGKDIQGIIPRLMQELKDSRNLSKKQMLEAKKQSILIKAEMDRRGIT